METKSKEAKMTTEAKHTPEPWGKKRANHPVDGAYDWAIGAEIDDGGPYCIAECVGRAAEDVWLDAEANAARIVACVNACAGIPTEQLQAESVTRLIAEANAVAERGQVAAPGPHFRWPDEYYEDFNRLRAALVPFQKDTKS